MTKKVLFEEAKNYLLKMPFIEKTSSYETLVCKPYLMGSEDNNFEEILNKTKNGILPIEDLQKELFLQNREKARQLLGDEFDGLARALYPEERDYNLDLNYEESGNIDYVTGGELVVCYDIGEMFDWDDFGGERSYLRKTPEEVCDTFLDFTLRQSLIYRIANELGLSTRNGLGFEAKDIRSVLDFNPLLLGMWKYNRIVNSAEYEQKLDEIIEKVNRARENIYR